MRSEFGPGDRAVDEVSSTEQDFLRLERLRNIERSLIEVTAIFDDRLDKLFELDTEVSPLPPGVAKLIQRLGERDEAEADNYAKYHSDRRLSERAATTRSLVARPVNGRFEPVDEPFAAGIRDVSETGIRLVSTRHTPAEYLALTWPAETLNYMTIRLVCNVTRVETTYCCYSVAGFFVMAD